MDYIVCGVTKNQTRLSDFHILQFDRHLKWRFLIYPEIYLFLIYLGKNFFKRSGDLSTLDQHFFKAIVFQIGTFLPLHITHYWRTPSISAPADMEEYVPHTSSRAEAITPVASTWIIHTCLCHRLLPSPILIFKCKIPVSLSFLLCFLPSSKQAVGYKEDTYFILQGVGG